MREEDSLLNLQYLRLEKTRRRLTSEDLASLTGYAASSVAAWFTSPSSARRRHVPDRAVAMMKAALKASDIEKYNPA